MPIAGDTCEIPGYYQTDCRHRLIRHFLSLVRRRRSGGGSTTSMSLGNTMAYLLCSLSDVLQSTDLHRGPARPRERAGACREQTRAGGRERGWGRERAGGSGGQLGVDFRSSTVISESVRTLTPLDKIPALSPARGGTRRRLRC